MILTERTINIIDHESIMDSPVVLYRGDKNVELYLTIKESKFKYRDEDNINVIESAQASYGQLVIKTPNEKDPIFSEITPTRKGTITFLITGEMIDEVTEVGLYDFQVRLLDKNKQSRATIPPIINGIEIREPITAEDSNVLNSATVGMASTASEPALDTFGDDGNYIVNNWKFGDRITDAKLNKMDDGIYESYKLGMYNSLQIKGKANKNEIFTMANMGQDIKEAMTGGSVPVVGENAVLNKNILDRQIEYEKLEFVESVVKKNLFKSDMKLDNNKCWKASDGTETTISGYCGTVKIKTEGNSYVYALSPKQVIFWDVNGNYLSFLRENELTYLRNIDSETVMRITIPSNAYYIGINFADALTSPMISFMDFNAIADYGYSKIVINEENKKILRNALSITDLDINERIKNSTITYKNLEFIEKVYEKNLFKSDMKLSDNKCWKASDGTEATISGYYGTVKIKTNSNKFIYALSPKQVIFWDVNGNYLSFQKESQFTFIRNIDDQSVMKIDIPTDAYYFGINFEDTLTSPMISFVDFETVVTDGYSKIVINEENKKILRNALGITDNNNNNNNNKYKDLKMNCMGDSITYGYTPGSGEQMDRPYPLILKELLGLSECRNYGISGSRLIGDSYNPVISRYSNMNDDADIISIFIGTNDYDGNGGGNWGSDLGTINDSDNTSFYGALNILCDGLLTKYPDKFIFFITPLHREGDTLPNARGCYLKDYVNAIKEVCEKFGIPVLDFYATAGFNANNSTQKTLLIPDGLHPNQLCQETKVAPQIVNFIKNNYI